MSKNSFWSILVGLLVGLVIGFIAANSYYRSYSNNLTSSNNNTAAKPKTDNDLKISDEEITGKIKQADQNPNQLDFQKQLGVALFQLTTMQSDVKYLPDAIRLLNRFYDKNPKDYEVIVTLGDAYLTLGKKNNEEENVIKGREFYQKSLQIKPNEVDVITNIGLSYLPDEKEKAMVEFQKSLKIDPKHERTLTILEKLKEQQ